MAADNINKLRLYQDVFNADGMTDENSLAAALLTQPDLLSPVITHLAGREDKRFPLSFLTEGMNKVKAINDIEYDYPVIGRLNKVVAVAVTDWSGTDKPGVGRTTFEVKFAERWFVKDYLIESPSTNSQCKVVDDPYQDGSYWVYKLKLFGAREDEYVAVEDLEAGKQWGQLFAPVTASGSRGNESTWMAPSRMRNQITHTRKSYRYEGNMNNKTINVDLPLPSGSTRLWMDFEEFQHMLRWKEECETAYWYSRYNKFDGSIQDFGDNGKVIPVGSGVLEQIPNYTTYAVLTATKLKEFVRDALYGASDAQDMNVTLFTGLGGLEEFDNAMKSELAAQTYIKLSDNKFVTGSGRNLQLGGFFTSYQHIDGHVISVRHLPAFDHGVRALKADRHPITGLPLESYRMVFLDMSSYDGEPNVQMITQKGREMLRWAVAGATIPKGFDGNALRASDIDGASVHFMKASGINIRRATNCLHAECTIS
jgi:hypothetical protein